VLKSVEPLVQCGELLGKNRCANDYLLDKPLSDANQDSIARGEDACHYGGVAEREGRLTGKGKKIALLWAWKGHLELIKSEVDRDLVMVLDGLEKLRSARPKRKKGKKKRAFECK
jgi:hypothetical protein